MMMDPIKNLKKIFIGALIFLCILMFFSVGMSGTSSITDIPSVNLSATVERYRNTVIKEAEKYDMSDYIELILCVMQVESNGEGNDPMQASEGAFNKLYPKQPNGIQDPLYSIRCGIQELKSVLIKANVNHPKDIEKIKVALAGYNFGPGYIDWVNKRGGKWTQANAIEFSNMMADRMGWEVYGDPGYVPKIMRYYQIEDVIVSSGDFISPLKNYMITSKFGPRDIGYHYGTDISAEYGASVYAPIDAIVYDASNICPPNGGYLGNQCPFLRYYGAGNYVMLKTQYKNETYYILLCHMKTAIVTKGQKVKKGQKIGEQGNSGNSTGSHVHIEIHKNTSMVSTMDGIVNPAELISFK